MKKKNKVILIVVAILLVAAIGFGIFTLLKKDEDVKETDAIKFKNEYTELNGKVNEYNDLEYVNVTLSDNNTMKYANEDEIVKLLKSGTGVIYFGFSTCPWCRSLVSTLAKVAEEKNETIHYLDVLDLRSKFEVKDGKLNKVKEGSKGYYQILELLDEVLEDYYLGSEDEKLYDTGEKRLYAPTLVAVKDGKITSFHVGTVESQLSGFDKLTETQQKELEDIVKKLINSKNNEVCTKDKC